MLAKLTETIAKLDSNITQIDADTLETGRGEIEVVVELRDVKQLEKLRRGIQAVPGVLRVDRRMGEGRPPRKPCPSGATPRRRRAERYAGGEASGCQVRTSGFLTAPLRRQRVQTRMRRGVPSTSAFTRCRLGSIVRLVTLWA